MKIAVLVYEYPPKIVGGLGTYAAEITRKFVLMDHDVTVFTMNDDAGTLPTREIWRGIEIHRPLHLDVSDSLPDVIAEDIRKWGRGIHLFGKLLVYNYLTAAKLINELIKKEGMNYDIVVAHDWLSVMGGVTVKKESGLPLAFQQPSNAELTHTGARRNLRVRQTLRLQLEDRSLERSAHLVRSLGSPSQRCQSTNTILLEPSVVCGYGVAAFAKAASELCSFRQTRPAQVSDRQRFCRRVVRSVVKKGYAVYQDHPQLIRLLDADVSVDLYPLIGRDL